MQGGLHLFGWRELPDRTVIGLELRLDAIKSRLGEVFPAATEAGEAYALRDAAGALWHRVGEEDASLTFEAQVLPMVMVIDERGEFVAAGNPKAMNIPKIVSGVLEGPKGPQGNRAVSSP